MSARCASGGRRFLRARCARQRRGSGCAVSPVHPSTPKPQHLGQEGLLCRSENAGREYVRLDSCQGRAKPGFICGCSRAPVVERAGVSRGRGLIQCSDAVGGSLAREEQNISHGGFTLYAPDAVVLEDLVGLANALEPLLVVVVVVVVVGSRGTVKRGSNTRRRSNQHQQTQTKRNTKLRHQVGRGAGPTRTMIDANKKSQPQQRRRTTPPALASAASAASKKKLNHERKIKRRPTTAAATAAQQRQPQQKHSTILRPKNQTKSRPAAAAPTTVTDPSNDRPRREHPPASCQGGTARPDGSRPS